MFLIAKYTQYKAAQAEQQKRKVTEKELSQLNHKIEKLLTRLDEHEPEQPLNQDEECVVCVNAKATMQTFPCNHRVLCRVCLVRCIQSAVSQRLLPLRCVICRAKILKLKHTNGGPITASPSNYTLNSTGSGQNWYHFPQSASLYSVTSNTSGVSAVSSTSSCSSASSYKTCASSLSSANSTNSSSLKKSRLSSYNRMGYQPLRTTSPSPTRKPTSSSGSRKTTPCQSPLTPTSRGGFQNLAKKDNRIAPVPCPTPTIMTPNSELPTPSTPNKPKGNLTLIQEFQKEFRRSLALSSKEGRGSTRIKCAKHLVNQASSTTPTTPSPIDPKLPISPGFTTTSSSSSNNHLHVNNTSSSTSTIVKRSPSPRPLPSSISAQSQNSIYTNTTSTSTYSSTIKSKQLSRSSSGSSQAGGPAWSTSSKSSNSSSSTYGFGSGLGQQRSNTLQTTITTPTTIQLPPIKSKSKGILSGLCKSVEYSASLSLKKSKSHSKK